ncbi:NAD-dependent epimerase/dehydratase family protein [Candidatus Shapirobacteria bacterium]|nr:NAD-dependent epimerase/dehydratase family protein [Candidatus Shapirobacteria bacterium]
MKTALVCGAGGFIGTHLVNQLKKEGYWVRGVDIQKSDFFPSSADEFLLLDLSVRQNCQTALSYKDGFDEVYQLAADRGGVGYMIPKECEMMSNNVLINTYMVDESVKAHVKKYFYSSSVCVYRDMEIGDPMIKEEDVYPALPDNEYGWEKLYSERVALAYARRYGLNVRIARFHTTYGPYANWEGLKPKAADDLCRKAALAPEGGSLPVWGDGQAVRVFTYIEDLISAIRELVKSDITEPTNLGSDEYVTVNELAQAVILASGKTLTIEHVDGPVGVKSRGFSNARIYTTGWRPKWKLIDGIKVHYDWIKSQVDQKYPPKTTDKKQ